MGESRARQIYKRTIENLVEVGVSEDVQNAIDRILDQGCPDWEDDRDSISDDLAAFVAACMAAFLARPDDDHNATLGIMLLMISNIISDVSMNVQGDEHETALPINGETSH
jgi:hypothetical protein